MDGNYVMVPDGEYRRLCGYEELFDTIINWLLSPENEAVRREIVERLRSVRR